MPYCLSEFFSEDVPLYDPSSGIITGIFVSDRKWSYLSYYHVLRFYEDGMVMSTSVVSRDIEADWRRTSFWFNRQSDRAEDLYGKYEFRDNQIYFTTHRHEDNWIEPLMTDWTGSYFDGKLFLLRIEQHSNGGWTATGTDVYPLESRSMSIIGRYKPLKTRSTIRYVSPRSETSGSAKRWAVLCKTKMNIS